MNTVETLLTLARRRFGPKADRLGPEDDLFEVLGIDSLAALDLLTDLEEAFDVEVPDYALRGVNTVAGLARLIEQRR
jgi:acyl carrier protein